MQKINPCLWFDHQAEEAARFYAYLFSNSKIGKIAYYGEAGSKVSGQDLASVLSIEFMIEKLNIVALNGGPMFKFSASTSFFVWCDSEAQIVSTWGQLAKGGEIRMALDTYPWATKYGWTKDRFGVEWQLMLAPQKQKNCPGSAVCRRAVWQR